MTQALHHPRSHPPTRAAGLAASMASAALAAACTDELPEDPGWADVAPVLAAHCVRCHGAPALGGAPPTFRLDRYDDTPLPTTAPGGAAGLRRVLGAAAMAEWIAARTEDGSMPPRFPLADPDRELLARWFAGRQPVSERLVLPRRGPARPGNAPPRFSLEAVPAESGFALAYELRDPDRDLVAGELTATPALPGALPLQPTISLGELHGGRGVLSLDTALLPAGRYALEATLDDGGGAVRSLAAEVEVTPPRPAPPRLALLAPEQGDYLAAAELPVAIEVTARDADTARLTLTATLVDDRAEATPIDAVTLDVAAGATTRVTLGTAGLPAGLTYRVLAEVSDGAAKAAARSGRFRVSRETTTDTFQTISDDILAVYCLRCHAGFPRVPTLGIDLSRYRGTAEMPGVLELRRRIYQRAVIAQSMPPGSARQRGEGMTPEDRARLARWLLAGAPE